MTVFIIYNIYMVMSSFIFLTNSYIVIGFIRKAKLLMHTLFNKNCMNLFFLQSFHQDPSVVVQVILHGSNIYDKF